VKDNETQNRITFTIDLLKGRGIPLKSGPCGIIIVLITALLPAVVAVSLYSMYQHNKVVTKMKRQNVLQLRDKTADLSDAVKMKNSLENEKVLCSACLSAVKTSLAKFDQWSPVLETLAQELPASVVLTNLSVKQDSIQKEVPKEDDPKKKIKISVPVTKLILKINNQGQEDCREEVKEFRDRLFASSVLGARLQNIVPNRKTERVDGKETVSYEIECLFKPEQ
jgi:hypothetical protein